VKWEGIEKKCVIPPSGTARHKGSEKGGGSPRSNLRKGSRGGFPEKSEQVVEGGGGKSAYRSCEEQNRPVTLLGWSRDQLKRRYKEVARGGLQVERF